MLLMILSSVLLMSILGFLPFNFYPAKIFLGDAGSGLLGYLLGTMAVMASSQPRNMWKFIAPILIIGVPVFDIAFAILRRYVRKKDLFSGDRDHTYDYFLKKSVSQPKVWLMFCSIQAVLVCFAIFLYNLL